MQSPSPFVAPGSRKRPRDGSSDGAFDATSRPAPTPINVRTSSKPSLVASVAQPSLKDAKKVPLVMSSLPARMVRAKVDLGRSNSLSSHALPTASMVYSPHDFLARRLAEAHISFPQQSFLQVKQMFAPVRPEEVEAYKLDVLNAVRANDLDKLREFHSSGRPLKCSNRFGESILHLACRRAQCCVASLLLKEVSVPLWVMDDFGRTPLTDGCWTPEPNFELIDMLLAHKYIAEDGKERRGSDLLYIADARGHTPLTYVRREHWKQWNDYLAAKPLDELRPSAFSATASTGSQQTS